MTCIVAVERGDGTATVGTDAFIGGSSNRFVIDRPKWHDFGCLRMLFAGSLRVPQVLAANISFGRELPDSVSEMIHASIPSIRKVLDENGATSRNEDGDTHSSEIIFVCKGLVYLMQSDFSVVRFASGYAAAGAGADFALGALNVMSTPRRSSIGGVTSALNAAATHCAQVCGPFHVEVV